MLLWAAQQVIGESELRAAIDTHWVYFSQASVKAKPSQDVYFKREYYMTSCVTGIDNEFGNGILKIHKNTPELAVKDLQTALEEKIATFRKQNLPFVVITEKEHADIQEILSEKGFVAAGEFQGVAGIIAGSLSKFDGAKLDSSNIEIVNSEDQLSDFMRIAGEAFEFTPSAINQTHAYFSVMKPDVIEHFLYYVNENDKRIPVSTLSLVYKDNAVSFWYGSTQKEYRKKHYLTVLAHFALCRAHDKGYKIAVSFLVPNQAQGIANRFGCQVLWTFYPYLFLKTNERQQQDDSDSSSS